MSTRPSAPTTGTMFQTLAVLGLLSGSVPLNSTPSWADVSTPQPSAAAKTATAIRSAAFVDPLTSTAPSSLALRLPVACLITDGGCVLARTLDHDPTPNKDQDYRCGPRASNDHDGTDIAVIDMAIAAQTKVLAAAAGTVKGTRDGMDDLGTRRRPPENTKGRECGNGVVIDHGNGWETQYCHLRQGSVMVHPGEHLRAGQELGVIGMSGESEFPHLHFSVRHNGERIDPFTGTDGKSSCQQAGTPLWTRDALAALPYQTSGFYHAGVAPGRPDLTAARDGEYRAMPSTSAPALVLWAELLAPRQGDTVQFSIIAPDQQVILDQTVALEKDQAQWFGFAGARRPGEQWPSGAYSAKVTLHRVADGGSQVLDVPLTLTAPAP